MSKTDVGRVVAHDRSQILASKDPQRPDPRERRAAGAVHTTPRARIIGRQARSWEAKRSSVGLAGVGPTATAAPSRADHPIQGSHLRQRAQARRRGRLQATARQLNRLHRVRDRSSRRSHRGAGRHRLRQRPGGGADICRRACRTGGSQAEAALRGDSAERRQALRASGTILHAGQQQGRLPRQSSSGVAARGVGYVPEENLIGRASIIFFSAATDDPDAFRLTSP